MLQYRGVQILTALVALKLFGCSSDGPAKDTPDGGATMGTDASDVGKAGKPGGASGTGAKSGMGGASGGGAASDGGRANGGTAGGGRAGGVTAGSAGDGAIPNDAGTGGAGTGDGGFGELGDIPGPDDIKQQPVLIDAAHRIDTAIGSVVAIEGDGDGTILLVHTTSSGQVATHWTKYGPDRKRAWSTTTLVPDGVTITDLARASGGAFFVTGGTAIALPGETKGAPDNNTDAFVGKFDSDGKAVWMHQWGGSSSRGSGAVVVARNAGSVVAAGNIVGQVPGNPAGLGPMFGVGYDATGARTFLKQYPPGVAVANWMSPDVNGDAFFGTSAAIPAPTGGSLLELDATGALAENTTFADAYQGPVAPAADGKSLYVASAESLAQVSLAGSTRWHRKPATQTAIIDPAEGVKQTFSFKIGSRMLATSDSLYVTGTYQNHYENGSSRPPDTRGPWLARLDLTGKQIWFQAFKYGVDPVIPPAGSGAGFPGSNPVLPPNANGNPAIALVDGNHDLFVLELHKSDGSVVSP